MFAVLNLSSYRNSRCLGKAFYEYCPDQPQVARVCKAWKVAWDLVSSKIKYECEYEKDLNVIRVAHGLERDYPLIRTNLSRFLKIPAEQLSREEAQNGAAIMRIYLEEGILAGYNIDLSSLGLTQLPREVVQLRTQVSYCRFDVSNNKLKFLPTNLKPKFFDLSNSGLNRGHAIFQTACLVSTVAFSVLSLIPLTRSISSLCLRCTGFFSSASICKESWSRDEILKRILNCSKTVLMGMGIVSWAMQSSYLVVGLLAVDICMHLMEAVRTVYSEKGEWSAIPFYPLIINTLLVAAMLTASSNMMAIAALLNGCLMLAYVCINSNKGGDSSLSEINIWCYSLLSVLSFINIALFFDWHRSVTEIGYFDINNTYDEPILIKGRDKQLIARLEPKQSIKFNLPAEKLYTSILEKSLVRIYPLDASFVKYWHSYAEDTRREMWLSRMEAEDFPTVPIGGLSFITNWQSLLQPWKRYTRPMFS